MIKERAAGMQTMMGSRRQKSGAPLYVRWNPEGSPYTIEIKLQMIELLAQAIRAAAPTGKEIGGLLMGFYETNPIPLLRVEEVHVIPSSGSSGPAYLLNPKQYASYVRQEERPSAKEIAPLGIFRTHLRASTARPSLADWTLLSGIFPRGTAMFLLVQADASDLASIFIREDQTLPKQPAVAPFRFDAYDLRGLPELEASAGRRSRTGSSVSSARPSRRGPLAAGVFLFAAIALAAYAWSGTAVALPFNPTDPNPGLAVNGDKVLKVTWNRHSDLVEKASSAKLLIVDGQNAREITLSGDELRSGSVDYERTHPSVQVMLVLSMPGNFSVTQSVAWRV